MILRFWAENLKGRDGLLYEVSRCWGGYVSVDV